MVRLGKPVARWYKETYHETNGPRRPSTTFKEYALRVDGKVVSCLRVRGEDGHLHNYGWKLVPDAPADVVAIDAALKRIGFERIA